MRLSFDTMSLRSSRSLNNCLLVALAFVVLNALLAFSTRDAFTLVTVYHYDFLNTLSEIVGWIYFLAWSVSFYPQIYYNWTRKR